MTQPTDASPLKNRFINLLRSIPIQCVGLGILFWGYHKFLIYSMRNFQINLGAVNYNRHAVPLYAVPEDTYLSWWILPAVAILGGFLLLCRKCFLQDGGRLRWSLLIAIACFIAIGISVAQIDGYKEIGGEPLPAFLESYTRTNMEYYGDAAKVNEFGFWKFLGDYAKPEVFKAVSGHGQTHPPGGALFLWIASKIFGYSLISASLVTIVFTSLTVIPVTLLARDLYGESVSRYALALFLITPNFVMFTTTSMDGPFGVFPIVGVYLFYKAIHSDRTLFYALLTGIALAFGMLMTYSTVFIGLFMGSVGLLTLITNREQFTQLLKVILIAAGAFAVFYLLLFLITGFNLLEAMWASIKKDERGMGTGYETIGRYFHLSFANLFAFLIGIGIPITTVWIRQIVATIRRARTGSALDTYVVGYLVALLAITFSTLFTMEVERIWIFMVPFIVIPVAKYLHERCEQRQRSSDFYWVAGLLCLQLILFEVTLYTYW